MYQVGGPARSNRGITWTGSCSPFLSTSHSIIESSLAWMADVRSSARLTTWPPARNTASPGCSPAATAGESLATLCTTTCPCSSPIPTPTTHRPGVRSNLGLTDTTCCAPSRSISQSISEPPFRNTERCRSKRFSMLFPSASRTTSPGCSPAAAAADSGLTWATTTVPTVTSVGTMNNTANTTMGRMAFISEPETNTMKRVPGPLPAKLRGTVGSFSPASRTNPPRGSQFTE